MRYRFNEAAEIEAIEAALYYSRQRTGLGFRFLSEVNEGIKTVLEAPLRWPEVVDGVRRYRLAHFPYGIFYRLAGDELEIVAIGDLRRKPGYWHDRLH